MAKQTFTTGQVLTAAQMTDLQATAMGGGAASTKTASYVLVAADAGTTVAMNAAGATTITVNTGLFAAGDTVFIQNIGAGVCTITAGTATVNTAGALALPQYDAGILYFTSTNAAIFYDYIQVGAASPLTTKGDLYTFSTSDTRIGVGANNTVLTADSAQATGLKWAAPASASGPAFKATGTTNQSLSASTWTKAELGTETFDTDSCYDPTTNYRFTPNKAGYYSFQTTVRITHGDATAYYQYGIYKNGTLENLLIIVTAQTSGSTYAASNLIYFNGTTDYAEFYVYTQATASQNLDRGSTFFSGVWIRS